MRAKCTLRYTLSLPQFRQRPQDRNLQQWQLLLDNEPNPVAIIPVVLVPESIAQGTDLDQSISGHRSSASGPIALLASLTRSKQRSTASYVLRSSRSESSLKPSTCTSIRRIFSAISLIR